jgi:hypothetical protein
VKRALRIAAPLAGLLLLGRPTGGQAEAAPEPDTSGASEVVAPPTWTPEERAAIALLRTLRRKERPSDEELAVQLGLGGERLVPLLFQVLARRSVPDLAGGPAQILSEIQENVVLLALAQLEREPVLGHATAIVALEPSLATRAAALAGIGAVGRANDLLQLFELALAGEEAQPEERLERALRRAVASVLARDPRALEQLTTLRRVTRPELLPALVEAVGASGNPSGLAYLSEIAYWHEGLVLDVMSQVPLLGPSGDEAIDGAIRVRLRPYLDEARPGPCRAAILALTALGDTDSLAALIELLESENAGLRHNAHWALKKLTGLTLASDAAAWSRWHQGELFWLLRSKPREFQRLRDDQPAVVADALREVLVHPLARAELAAALPDLLKSRAPAIRVLACRTLAELDTQVAVEKLVWALEDPVAEVSQAAHAALRKLTRLDLPNESLAWQSATNTAPRGTEL